MYLEMNKRLSYKELENKVSKIETELDLKDKEVNKLKYSFLSNISHEIRTPMNVIVGFSNLLNNPNYDQKQKEFFVGEINKNSRELLRLIDNIILSAKIETDDLKLNMDFYNIHHLIEDIYDQFQKHFKLNSKQNIEIKLIKNEIGPNHKIFTDPEKLKRAMLNLLESNLKSGNIGAVKLGYQIIDDKFVNIYLEVNRIGNNGNEIKENMKKQQVEIEDHINENAVIGLTISDKLIRLLGGKLKIKTILGQESLFNFTIPLFVEKPV
jgi:signal transduction histidine kinase